MHSGDRFVQSALFPEYAFNLPRAGLLIRWSGSLATSSDFTNGHLCYDGQRSNRQIAASMYRRDDEHPKCPARQSGSPEFHARSSIPRCTSLVIPGHYDSTSEFLSLLSKHVAVEWPILQFSAAIVLVGRESHVLEHTTRDVPQSFA